MVHRGLRRRFDPLVEREARIAAEEVTAGPERARLPRPADVHDRPADGEGLRRRDLAPRSCADGAIRVWVHIADVVGVRQARLGASTARRSGARTRSTCPGWSSRCCPRRCRTARARWCPGEDRLTVTVELEFDGAKVRRTAFHRSVIRSDERLDYPRVDRIFAGAERAARPVGGAAGRGAQGGAGAGATRARQRGALAVESSEPEFGFSRDGHVESLAAVRADRVAPADRVPDDRRQRGGRGAAREAQAARAVPRARAAGPAAGRAADRAARVARRPDAAAARRT